MFLGCNILQRGGSRIYQPFIGSAVSNCNYSVYSDGVETINIPFIPCDQVVPYENESIQSWLFDTPFVGSDVPVLAESGGFYDYVSDIVSDDGDFTIGVSAERLIRERSVKGKYGATFNITGTQQSRFIKTRTGNEGWFLPQFCIVINMIVPTAFASDFEYVILMMDFNNRPLSYKKNTGDSTTQFGIKDNYSITKIPYGTEETFLVGTDGSGNYYVKSKNGTDYTKTGFTTLPATNMALGFIFNNLNKVGNALIHEISVLPFWPNETQQTEIYTRSADRWYNKPDTGATSFTADGNAMYTADGGTYIIQP